MTRVLFALAFLLSLMLPSTSFALTPRGEKNVTEGMSRDEWRAHANELVEREEWSSLLSSAIQQTRSDPEDPLGWIFLGHAYFELRRHNDAINAWRNAVQLDPERDDLWSFLGWAYLHMESFSDAVNAFHQTVRLAPDREFYWFSLGIAYLESGNRAAALNVVHKLKEFGSSRADNHAEILEGMLLLKYKIG